MVIRRFFYFYLILLLGCSPSRKEGLISKASTNSGLTCQRSDVAETKNELSIKAIYGTDNRLDWYESPGETKNYWAKATLALVSSSSLVKEGETYRLYGPSYKNLVGLCPGQAFEDQPSVGFCTGFLVSKDLVVTAGHCMQSSYDCQNTRFVFDFAKTSIDQEEYRVGEDKVFHCSEVIAQETGANDYAIVRLDREVSDRTPLNVRRSGQLGIGEQVMLIGHPMGLPSKIADGGFVQSVGNKIVASVDAFAANSGSPLFNSQTGIVEGLLVSGEADFRIQNGCRVEAVCGNECQGEAVTPISKILPHIPNVVYENPICR